LLENELKKYEPYLKSQTTNNKKKRKNIEPKLNEVRTKNEANYIRQ